MKPSEVYQQLTNKHLLQKRVAIWRKYVPPSESTYKSLSAVP
ncbi:hypothetical protein NOR53_1310 [gamma proteobacterium NOR5-3]|nr:hypothetical protein NOR53_1310 [gamma proteobacterium NOR5-3]